MQTAALPRPVVPEDLGRRSGPSNILTRTAAAIVRGRARPGASDRAAGDLFPNDRIVETLTKATSSPGTTTSSGWADMAAGATTEFLGGLVGASSGLIGRAGVRIVLRRGTALTVPTIVSTAASGPAFVGEGDPIRVITPALGGVTLAPRKIGIIATFTRELAQHTAVEAIVRSSLRESMGLALDAALLGNAAATDETPAGLLSGITPITATTGGGTTAMLQDVGALANAIAPVAGSNIVFVAAPGEAVKLQLFANPSLPYPVLASSALASGTVVAVAPAALAVATDPTPEIVVSADAVVHEEDTDPEQIGSAPAGTDAGGDVAAPARSLFQTDVIGLRLILGVTWAMRAAGGVAVVDNVTW